MEERFEDMLREAMDEETPPLADARIRTAMRLAGMSYRRRRRLRFLAAAAAGLALLVGGGALLFHGNSQERDGLDLCSVPVQREADMLTDGDVMLEIIGMADVDDFCSMQVAQM